MLGTVLLVVLILLLIGAAPTWQHSRSWGYGPSGLLGTILVVVLILMLLGRILRRLIRPPLFLSLRRLL